MAAKLSITDIDAQIEKLRERRKTLIVKSAERFARAATKAGLAGDGNRRRGDRSHLRRDRFAISQNAFQGGIWQSSFAAWTTR